MTDAEWQGLNEAFAQGVSNLPAEVISRLKELALAIKEGISRLDPFFERYCKISYPKCQEVCCNTALVLFETEDLLFIHALGLDPPPHPTRRSFDDPCLYLSVTGCALPRIKRPYRCTWFMCDLHLECFYDDPPKLQRSFLKVMEGIRINKAELSRVFLEARGGWPWLKSP